MATNSRQTVGGASSEITSMDTVKRDQSAGASVTSDGSGLITQSERAFTIRPRSTPLTNALAYTSDRGPISSIRLITDKSKATVLSDLAVSQTTSSAGEAVDYVVGQLMQDPGWSDFIMTNVDVNFTEKVQVNEVFGDSEVVYYFGRSPIQFNLSGILFDDVDNNWFYNFVTAYATVLRGTQMAKNYQLAKIMLPNMTIVGTITGMSYTQDATRDTDIRFQMQFLAKSVTPRPVLLPSELLSNNALKINIKQAETPARFKERAEINNVKRSIEAASAYLGSSMGAGDSMFSDYLGGVGDSINDIIHSAKDYFDESSSGLFSVAELRANIFSPIYGVLTTLTKVVSSLVGEITSLLGSAENPLNSILRDVKSISNEAIALANAVTGGVNALVKTYENSQNEIRKTIQALKNAAGAISSTPENVSDILKRLSKAGRKKGYIAQIKSGSVSRTKKALINSGAPYTPSSGAVINN